MKRILAILTTALLIVGCSVNPRPIVPSVPPTVPVALTVQKSIVRLTQNVGDQEVGICTAFSIAPRKFLTAAHCIGDVKDFHGNTVRTYLKANGVYAVATYVDGDKDLAIVLVDIVKPSVAFRLDPLRIYEMVQAVGYGHGLHQALTTDQTVLALKYDMDSDGEVWPGTLFMRPFIGGMSGGPVFDKDGAVVGVVQRASPYIGYGVDVETVREFLAESE